MRGSIYTVERNRYGMITIRGCIGMRSYIGYTKKEAVAKYRAEVLEKRLVLGDSVIYLEN